VGSASFGSTTDQDSMDLIFSFSYIGIYRRQSKKGYLLKTFLSLKGSANRRINVMRCNKLDTKNKVPGPGLGPQIITPKLSTRVALLFLILHLTGTKLL
jgi:hypothetical protein